MAWKMIANGVPSARKNRILRLYVAGDTQGGRRALENRIRLLAEVDEHVVIEVVDVLAHPEEAERVGILATPTLSDESVTPPRRLIGDFSDLGQVLEFFGVRSKGISP